MRHQKPESEMMLMNYEYIIFFMILLLLLIKK